MKKYTDEEFASAVNESVTKTEICQKLGLPYNGANCYKIRQDIRRLGLDISHFVTSAELNRKYPKIKKKCPVCKKKFEVAKGAPREKTTCSYACANTHFRSGENNPNWRTARELIREDSIYRRLCFETFCHDKKCIICGWDISVDVHHVDGNHENNSSTNLAPVCPNCHRMAGMTKYKEKIRQKLESLLREHFNSVKIYL